MSEQLTRHEAIELIQQRLGDTEEAAHVIDWAYDMWETMEELSQRLSPALARKVFYACRFRSLRKPGEMEQQEPSTITLAFTPDETITVGAAITLARMHVSQEQQLESSDTLAQLEHIEKCLLEATRGEGSRS